MKRLIPWWLKICAKIILSRFPVGYYVWQKLGLFRHGSMDRVDYALGVFQEHVSRAGMSGDLDGRVILEVGPGDSVAMALVAYCYGARAILVDTGPFALSGVDVYRRFSNEIAKNGNSTSDIESAETLEDILDVCNATYFTEGIDSFPQIEAESVDLVFSQAVLEHIRKHEFLDIMRECHRILKPNGIASHRVDLKDHLGGSLNNLRFSEKLWESKLFARSGFYTNRIRFGQMLDCFRRAGFEVAIGDVRKWDHLPVARSVLAPPFSEFSDDELLVSGFDVVLRKSGSQAKCVSDVP